MDALLLVLLNGAAAAGTSMIIRGLTPGKWRGIKPFSCPLCLSVWSSLLVAGAQWIGGSLAPELNVAWVVAWGLRYLGSVSVSVVLLGQTTMFLEMPTFPPTFPDEPS